MSSNRLKDYLNSRQVKYITIAHSPAYTAQEIAASAHIKGQELAKTVMVRLDGKIAMCVLPASHSVDFARLRGNCGARDAVLVPEQEYRDLFPDCAPGAQPPFGNLYGVDVLVSSALISDREIAFNACSFSELIRLSLEDYLKLVEPAVIDLSVQPGKRRRAA
ncbi:MAG: deacylase [Nitrospirae bacterium GWD2_57_9]|nr:MAG: deacylase [Nitrospirae bacterium GWD2_57_9]OGW48216.1 MAG: deacylase [Nitrospirae bacterium GWC2_57_9]